VSPERLAQIRKATHGDGPVPSVGQLLLMAMRLVDYVDTLTAERDALLARIAELEATLHCVDPMAKR
jgi:hypothetical protein